jgi:hypothetical protein
VTTARHGRLAALLSLLLAAGAAGAAAPSQSLVFEQVFRTTDRGSLHYRGTYLTPSAEHHVEAWRDGATRLKRVTDDTVETHVTRERGSPDFQMTVLDRQRKIATRIARDNLYRIGNFTDWFDLAHALRHPKGEYRLTRIVAPAAAPHPIGACTWYRLEQGGAASSICWSTRAEVPLLVVSAKGETVWRITSLDMRRIAQPVFAIDERGYVRNDANEDIERD